jgi:hypothetical protein
MNYKIIKEIKGDLKAVVREEIVSYLRALFTRKTQLSRNNFVIFTQGRTGSNLLRSLLNSHPNIFCIRDPFVRWHIKVLFPKLHLQGKWAKYSKRATVCGLLLHDMHLNFQKIAHKEILSYFYNQGWKIIHLRRENFFNQITSARFAFNHRQWHYRSAVDCESICSKNIYIAPTEMIQLLEEREARYLREEEVMAQFPHLKIVFEKDLSTAEQHQKTVDKICGYLGISSVPVQTELIKTPRKTKELLQNYEEIAAFLKNTRYAHFLEMD